MLNDTDPVVVESPNAGEDEFMITARRRFQNSADAEREVREQALIDLRFRSGDQWDDKAREIRDKDNRPCLTINRIPQFIHQVTNEQRQQRPSLQVHPTGYGAERDAADIWEGLMRHIEYRSDAEAAYDTAFEHQVGNSFGWWRITSEYAGDDTFDQELCIKRILDPFSVYCDPSAKEPDRSDMRWAFVLSDVGREEYKRDYPKSTMASMGFYDSYTNPAVGWVSLDSVRIAEYWVVETKKRTLQMLTANVGGNQAVNLEPSNLLQEIVNQFGEGRVGEADAEGNVTFTAFEDEYETLPLGVMVKIGEDGKAIERILDYPHVHWYKINGVEVLEDGEWPGKWIPLIPCLGDELIVDGKKQLISLTRFIRDSQALYNFMRSQQAEVIALTPKAPFIGPVGAFKTHQKMWQNANNVNFAYLEYDLVSGPDGRPAPPPQRNVAEAPIQAVTEAAAQANDDLKAGTGIYDPSLGQRSNETSGRAILARQQESNTSNFHFLDNFRRSMRHQGRILMDLIPHYYDRRDRIVRIVKPDTTSEMVMINGSTMYKGKPAFFDPSVGRYDVTVQVGPSFQSQTEQTFEMLSQFVQSNPQIWSVAGDLIMRASPLPGSIGTEMADRMKMMLPPAIQAMANQNSSDQKADPATQAKLMQATQMIQMLTGQVQALHNILQTKKLEIESKERIAAQANQVQLLIADLKAGTANAQQLAQLDFASLQHRLDLLHEGMSLEQEAQQAAQELQLAQQQQQQQQNQPKAQ